MFIAPALQDVAPGLIACGIIWALVMGFAVGNYACSLVHRLPRGKALLDKTPYCGSCAAPLQVKDLFPVFSALLLRHRCRYCGVKYPVSHTITELLVGALFVLAFLHFGYGEMFVLVAALGTFLITLGAIEANDHIIMGKILIAIAVCGMVLRTLVDISIYGFVGGAVVGAAFGALIWRRKITKVGHVYVLPIQAQLFAVGGLCVGIDKILFFMPLFVIAYLLSGKKLSIAFGAAILLPVFILP